MATLHTVTAQEAHELLKSKKAILIDVREPAEYKAERIPGATNIPLSKIQTEHMLPYKNIQKKVLIHCLSGRRSKEACKKVLNACDFDLYSVDGGITHWKEAGFPIKTSQSFALPLDRQVQLTISIMILLGLLIHWTLSPYGLVLPLIAGLGLLNAALTGWCGMAKLLAKMPWNQ
jgi:rhodanese-related sulfurtransferase